MKVAISLVKELGLASEGTLCSRSSKELAKSSLGELPVENTHAALVVGNSS